MQNENSHEAHSTYDSNDEGSIRHNDSKENAKYQGYRRYMFNTGFNSGFNTDDFTFRPKQMLMSRKPVILTVLAIISGTILTLNILNLFITDGNNGPLLPWFLSLPILKPFSYSSSLSRHSRFVYSDAETLSITNQPYIYPDLLQIGEFRRSRRVVLSDGRKAASKTHAILYKNKNKFKSQTFLNNNNYDGKTLDLNGNDWKPVVNQNAKHLISTQCDEFEKLHQDPPIVLVLGLDASRYSKRYLELVLKDRMTYAKKHGYGLYVRYLQDFEETRQDDDEDDSYGSGNGGGYGYGNNNDGNLSPLEFAKAGMMRQAMFAFSTSAWFWWLDQDAVITNHDFDIGTRLVLNKQELARHMQRNSPLVPSSQASTITTYQHTAPTQIRMIVLQNGAGINAASFLVRQDPLYGRVVMEYLMDPALRGYSGIREVGTGNAFNLAVTHMLKWHPLILSRVALVSSSFLGAYPDDRFALRSSGYKKGDFVYLLKSSLVNNKGVLDADFIMDEWMVVKSGASKA